MSAIKKKLIHVCGLATSLCLAFWGSAGARSQGLSSSVDASHQEISEGKASALPAHVRLALLAGGSFGPGPASPRVGVDADCFLPKRLDLFERGWYDTAGRDGGSLVSLGVPVAGQFSVDPGFVATHAGGQNVIRPSLGLTYLQGPHFLVHVSFLTRDRLGAQGIDTGLEYLVPSKRRWGPKVAIDVLHLWPAGTSVADATVGVYF